MRHDIATLLGAIAVASTVLASGTDGLSKFIDSKDVCFPHEMHFSDLEIECESCHHETHAASLDTPHAKYFEESRIECTTCHQPEGVAATSTACSSCHHDSPTDIADETLSSKVVVHQTCWRCHEVATGAEASRSCSSCHNGTHYHPHPDKSREETAR